MKSVIIISDSYYPDKTSSAKLLKDLTDELLKNNIKVTILTTGEKNILINKKNLKILKNKIPFINSQNFFIKFIGEIIMPYIFLKNYSKKINYSSNLLICYSPSIFFKPIVDKIKLFPKSKKLLLIRDIFPDWLIDAQIINKNSFRYRLLKLFQKRFYESFDILSPQSNYDKKYIKKIQPGKKILTIKNWINFNKKITKISKNRKIKKIIFGGNIGIGQDKNFIIHLVKVLNNNFSNFKFYMVGSGRGIIEINKLLNNNRLSNFYIIDKLEQKNYVKYLNTFDLGIISLNKNIKYSNFPGKLLTYLECGLPVLAYCSKKIELFKFIKNKKIGCSIDTYNKNVILNSLKKIFYNQSFKKKNYKLISQNVLKEEFSVKKVTQIIMDNIN